MKDAPALAAEQPTAEETADICFEVGYKTKTKFNLRMISVLEESLIQQKFNDIADTDTDKNEKEYKICLDALCEFSAFPGEGERLRISFADMTNKNERIIRAAFQQFRFALSPETNFF